MTSLSHAVLDLQHEFGHADAAEVLQRLQRAPAVLAALRDEQILEVTLSLPPTSITPGTVVRQALNLSGLDIEEWDPETTTALETAATEAPAPRGRLARLAQEAAHRYRRFTRDPGTVEALADCECSVIVLVYSQLLHSGQEEVAQKLLRARELGSARLQALLAEHTEPNWADVAKAYAGAFDPDELLELTAGGERDRATLLAQAALENDEGRQSANAPPDLHHALLRTAAGDVESSIDELEAAWEASLDHSAAVADALAEVARGSEDMLLEKQARQRSLEILPTPERRASYALTLVREGEPEQALKQINRATDCTEEVIAIGLAQLALGNFEGARSSLRQATADAPTIAPRWIEALAEGWVDLGEPGEAVHLLNTALRTFPGHLRLRQRLAELALTTGAHGIAADQAALLAVQRVDDPGAVALLAQALQVNGEAERSLPLWLQLAEDDPKYKPQAVEAALEAEDLGTALAFSQELVDMDPDSAPGRVALGKSLVAAGNASSGQRHLERATEIDPGNAQAWLALAHAQLADGQAEAAGDTLRSAQEACPNQASIHAAHAEWLAEEQRWTEAVKDMSRALELAPADPDYRAQYGCWLAELGRLEEAIDALEVATSQRPYKWGPRVKLASLFEAAGRETEAVDILRDLPEEAPSEAHFLAGRVALAGTPGEQEAERALAHLKHAGDSGLEVAELGFWRAKAHQALGQFGEAIQCYQACQQELGEDQADLNEACLRGTAECALASDQLPLAISVLERARGFDAVTPQSLSLLSSAYLKAGLADDALSVAVEAWEAAPEDDSIRQQFLRAAREAGDSQVALDKIQAWRVENPADAPLLIQQAELHYQLDQREQARRALAEALWTDRRDPEILHRAGETLLAYGEPQPAKTLLATAEDLLPEDVAVARSLARAAEAANDPATSRRAWEKVLAGEAESVEALVGLAEALWRLDQRASAIGQLQRAVSRAPDRANLQLKLARYQLANGEVQRAMEHFRSAAQAQPDDADVVLEAAKALLENGAAGQSLALLEPIAEGALQEERVATLAARAYLQNDQPEEALVALRRLQAAEASPAIHALFSLAECAAGRPAAAIERLQRARAARPTSSEDASLVAQAALRLGEWSVALEVARQLLSTSQEEASVLTGVRIVCRVADARTLIATLAGAENHAPGAELLRGDLAKDFARSLDRLTTFGVAPSQVEAIRTWGSLAFGDSEVADPEFVKRLPRHARLRVQAIEGCALQQLKSEDPEGALQTLAGAEGGRSAVAGRWSPLLAGIAHQLAERPSMARKALGAVGSDAILRPLAAYFAAESWATESRWTEAVNNLNTAVLEWPQESAWQHKLADLYLQLDRPEAALPHLQKALEQDPADAAGQRKLARVLSRTGNHSEADEIYQRALEQSSGDIGILTEAAAAALTVGQPERAEQLYRQALELDPADAKARVGAARASLLLGDERAAEKHAAKALRQSPDDPEILVGLGDVFSRQQRFDQALAMYREARAGSADPVSVDLAQGRTLMRMGRAQQAIEILNRVVSAQPEADRAWAALGEAYAAGGQPHEAIDALRMAIQLRPGSRSYRLQLASTYRESGQLDQALALLSELQNEAPEDYQVALELGLVHRARREWREALSAFQHAIELNSESAAAHYQAGMTLKTMKAYPRAAQMLQRAVDLNPNDSEALHQLAAVQALELVHGGMQTTAVTP